MSVIQVEEYSSPSSPPPDQIPSPIPSETDESGNFSLVSYNLRTSYLNEVADGVGERLITLNEAFLNSAPFKAAGWRPNPVHIKRTHSPPIPTAIASEYFQAPRAVGLTLEDDQEEGGSVLTGGGADVLGPGALLATKRARRRREREQMDDDDSSDLSDESDDEADHRAAQQIKFAKMPLRNRSGSSPIQSSNLRQTTTLPSPRAAPTVRRGSQSALETVKERARRDTVTSSEVSSENEFDVSGFHRQREAGGGRLSGSRGAIPKLQTRGSGPRVTIEDPPIVPVNRRSSELLPEEDDDSDASDMSSVFGAASIDSASILGNVDNPINPATATVSPTRQIVGTPPREFTRSATVRRVPPKDPEVFGVLPPPRPLSTIRPMSMIKPKSLLSAALKVKKSKPFESFAALSGQGDPNPISIRIFAPFSKNPSKSFDVFIRRRINEGDNGDRHVMVAELIGLSLWRYNEEKREPHIPNEKMNVNWWTLKMVEDEFGDVDDDFPPLERTKPLISFATNNDGERTRGKATRSRANSKPCDYFALVEASRAELDENQSATPQFEQQEVSGDAEEDPTPKSTTQNPSILVPPPPRQNPLLNTTYRPNVPLADMPQTQSATTTANTSRGRQKYLHINIMSSDTAPGQMVTVDVTTEMYLAEVLDIVCKKRQLDKANHVLKLPNSGAVALVDRTVSSIGNVSTLELHRRRFATDGPLTVTGSLGSSAPKTGINFPDTSKKSRKGAVMVPHPLAQEALKQEELGNAPYKKWVVWRKQPMRFVGMSERILAIDGEYIHIMPSSGGKMLETSGKVTTVHFSTVVGCKVSRRHPSYFKLIVYKATTESKRYDFETKSQDEAAEIVTELEKGISPYRRV
ncbi:putative stress activated map kinase interacting protein sin1 protein [Zalerion maritima]|uniref:Stress activated map kinase interacting protein sin1 protein n=1 Tax=Zalerion maritima TaxID=339359 RepID=A0AAD5RWD3_9PEZI|nr:putative stress activated map kinase interacting protein sin1 protein [Zalerion maritima]